MSVTVGVVIPDHPRNLEKGKLKLSGELYSKGKSAMKSEEGFTPTDIQIAGASLMESSALPSDYSLSTPTPEDQGGEGSCVPFATAYGARSIEYYYKTGGTSYSNSVNVFSPEYVYNQTNFGGCASGTSIQTCLDLMKNQGVCLWNTMPYESGDCATQPDSNQVASAANFKINSYNLTPNLDRAAIKGFLASNHPVIATVIADNSFVNAPPGFVWTVHVEGALPHTLVICGYDDSKNAYKVLNSWGTDWCDSGFGWIDYDLFPTISSYYVYTINETTPLLFPTANAGYDVSVTSGAVVALDGSASSDPDGFIASYLWEWVSGPASPTINNSTSPVASITPSVAGTYVYKLTVTDNNSNTAFDTVAVTVTASVSESLSLTVTKKKVKGKTIDSLTWNIVLNNSPQFAQLQTTTTSNFVKLYDIIPYSAQGTYSYTVTTNRKRYYRLKVIKSDGTIIYSTTVSIQ